MKRHTCIAEMVVGGVGWGGHQYSEMHNIYYILYLNPFARALHETSFWWDP